MSILKFIKKHLQILTILDFTFSTLPIHIEYNPIALMKTNSKVEPALIKGNGSPVGGIEPLNISYCIINFSHLFYRLKLYFQEANIYYL